MSCRMSVDVAFESAEEISRKLSRYEQLFKSRYTEADAGYRRCVANAEKLASFRRLFLSHIILVDVSCKMDPIMDAW